MLKPGKREDHFLAALKRGTSPDSRKFLRKLGMQPGFWDRLVKTFTIDDILNTVKHGIDHEEIKNLIDFVIEKLAIIKITRNLSIVLLMQRITNRYCDEVAEINSAQIHFGHYSRFVELMHLLERLSERPMGNDPAYCYNHHKLAGEFCKTCRDGLYRCPTCMGHHSKKHV